MSRNLGVIAPIPKDSWNSSMSYKALSIVTHNGSLYMAKNDVRIGVLPTENEYWMLLISQANAENVVKYTAQSASELEQLQARTNIGTVGYTHVMTAESNPHGYLKFRPGEPSMWIVTMETTGTLSVYHRMANWVAVGTISVDTPAVFIITNRTNNVWITNIRTGQSYTYLVSNEATDWEIGVNCPYAIMMKFR